MRSVAGLLAAAAPYLAERGVPSPRLDAELLLAEAIAAQRIDLYTHPERPVDAAEVDAFRELIRRRGRREPVAYLLGRRAFRRLTLRVTPDVLIPRPETEHLVEIALAARPASVLDVGTGSGAVALAIADEAPGTRVCGTDASEAALAVARANGLEDARHADLVVDGPWDAVVSNPPYVPDGTSLEPELGFEPPEALFGGPDGLDVIRRLVPAAVGVLAPGGLLALEVGAGQAVTVAGLLAAAGYAEVGTVRDLAGHERVVHGRIAARPAP
jgi:release factor glutamine methyltransferase